MRGVGAFVKQQMGTADVRVDPTVNKYLWSQGIRSVPRRVRVQMDRKVGEEGSELYTVVSLIPISKPAEFRGLLTEKK